MEHTKVIEILENHSARLNSLEGRVNTLHYMHHKIEKHDETLLLHDSRLQMIMKKLLELHEDLQQLASTRQHVATAFAALGGAIVTYLIHFLH